MRDDYFKLLADEPDVALPIIIKRHGAQLRARIDMFVRDDDELAQDVFSETLVAIWVARKKVAAARDPFVFVMAIAKKIALYMIRSENKYKTLPAEFLDDLADYVQADTEMLYKERREQMLDAAEMLTPKERNILIDAKLEQWSNKELSEKYDVSVQHVKNVLSSALKKLRALLKDRD